jgi:hypothetical protein
MPFASTTLDRLPPSARAAARCPECTSTCGQLTQTPRDL